jgi:hypothetical protein
VASLSLPFPFIITGIDSPPPLWLKDISDFSSKKKRGKFRALLCHTPGFSTPSS